MGWIEKRPRRTTQCVAYLQGIRNPLGLGLKPENSETWCSGQWKAWREKGGKIIGDRSKRKALARILDAAATGKLGKSR